MLYISDPDSYGRPKVKLGWHRQNYLSEARGKISASEGVMSILHRHFLEGTTFEYKFVKIKIKYTLRGTVPVEDYHAIIEKHAADGWRLVQVFSPPIGGCGSATFYELIFERERG
jgi:hypothetical protein